MQPEPEDKSRPEASYKQNSPCLQTSAPLYWGCWPSGPHARLSVYSRGLLLLEGFPVMWSLFNSPGKRDWPNPQDSSNSNQGAVLSVHQGWGYIKALGRGPGVCQLAQGPGGAGLRWVAESASRSQMYLCSAVLQDCPIGLSCLLFNRLGLGLALK